MRLMEDTEKMEKVAELYGFDKVKDFAQFLISRARKERLIISIELSERNCKMSIEPLENRVYICPYYGETREER